MAVRHKRDSKYIVSVNFYSHNILNTKRDVSDICSRFAEALSISGL